MKIGDLAKKTKLGVDTLRYYEKIGLLTDVERNESGYRNYKNHNVEQVRFIRNAQHSGFSLEEIRHLLEFRQAPVVAKAHVRKLAQDKANELTERIESLTGLRDELLELVGQCEVEDSHCPIIDKFSDA